MERMVWVRIFLYGTLCKAGAFAEGETEAQHTRCPAVPNQPKHGINPFFQLPSQRFPRAFTQIPPEGCPLLRVTCTPLPPALHTPREEGDGDYGWLCASHGMFLKKKTPPRSGLLPAHVHREGSTGPYKGCVVRAHRLALLCSPAFLGIPAPWLVQIGPGSKRNSLVLQSPAFLRWGMPRTVNNWLIKAQRSYRINSSAP